MIEEKEDLEQEIYDLCENVNIINEKMLEISQK